MHKYFQNKIKHGLLPGLMENYNVETNKTVNIGGKKKEKETV